MASKKHKTFRVIWLTFVFVFVVWQAYSYQARGLPKHVFTRSERIEVQEDIEKISFISAIDSIETEVIFFQGGLVDPEAYAPLCRGIAEAGFSCHIVKMDWRMPAWGYEQIKNIFDLDAGNFVLAGHSQGGKVAAQFVYENTGLMKGLILLGTSHPRDVNLSKATIPTLKLYAEHDGLASVSEVLENQPLLPHNTSLVMIEGGNHSQFGYMGHLLLDSSAEISVEAQHKQILQNIILFLNSLSDQI